MNVSSPEVAENWTYSDDVEITSAGILLNKGKVDSYSYFAHKRPLGRDDFLQIALRFSLGKPTATDIPDRPWANDHKVNGFFIQFTPNSEPLLSSFADAVRITLHGLVVMLISHHDKDDHGYHILYRYFDRPTEVRRAYIDILFDEIGETRNVDKGCKVNPHIGDITWTLELDFERENSLRLLTQNGPDESPMECFTVHGINRYIDIHTSYINLFTSMGSESVFDIILKELVFAEKKHRLDVKEALHVSHELAAEIFDKVKTYTGMISQNKEMMRELTVSYKDLAEKSGRLELFMQDLFRGTRRFEEHVVESITKLQSVNPETLPKLMRVKILLNSLQHRQEKIFQRLVTIKGQFAAKKVFRKARKMLKKVELSFKELSEDIGSQQFSTFFTKIEGFVDLLRRIDLQTYVEDVRTRVAGKKAIIKKAKQYGVISVVILAGLSLICSWLIFRMIAKAEKL
jgi:hypothetical protein